jgi:soluble lytic murein transglycosylase-like protein
MVKQDIRDEIEEVSKSYGFDPNLIESFVITESSGNPLATRYEPAFYRKYILPMLHHNAVTVEEAKNRATSWGLMQIMGQVARELGFKDSFHELLIPGIGLFWSCKHLKNKFKKYGDHGLDYVIASYNAGSPRKNNDGLFYNQKYVDKVNGYLNKIKAEHSNG